MTSILSRLLTSDKPWTCPYATPFSPRPPTYTGYSTLMSAPSTGDSSKDLSSTSVTSSTVMCPDSSRDGYPPRSHGGSVRFGRVPKREKAKILAAMQKVNASSQEKALGAELEDELKLLSTIVCAHEETCDYTKDKVQVLIEKAREHPVYAQCPQQLACPLNSAPHIIDGNGSHYMEDFSERFTPAIQGVVEYAKRIPGFSFLSQDDQLTLLKAGVFEVLLVRLACMFDSRANTLISLNGQVLRRESLHSASNARFLLDSMFDFAERLNALHLTDSEVGLFSAVVVIAADRPGLRNTELVLKIQKKLMDILQKSVLANHPENPNIFADLMKKIPDLRTLNTLHSEKLLAYKMEPRNQSAPTSSSPSSSSSPVTASTNGAVVGPNIYATIPHEIWSQYSLVTTHPPCLASEEDVRSTSPGQHSEHSGTSTVSEWSTTDSTKDDHDLIGSPRSVGSGLCIDDAKSPVRTSSFSSSRSYANEEVWPGEVQPNGEYRNVAKRGRDGNGSEHGSSSGDEGYFMDSPVKTTVYPKLRRVDSPTDSGIESGKEHGPSTTPTISVCSSPRSSVDEKVKDDDHAEKNESVEDMPVLKRALQAPPLVNTNMLMDEAYRHHKKFRAARRDAESPSSPSSLSLASTHSTLVRTLEQAPRYLSEQQLKRTDLIHNIIMRTETLPGQPTQQSPVHHQNQPSPQHHPQLPPHSELTVQPPQQQQQQSNRTNNLHITINGSYPYTSVPNPVPPNYATSPQQQKNVLVCPSGYYIPNGSATATVYSGPPASWPCGPSSAGQSPNTTTAGPATTVTPSTMHSHYQVALANDHPQHHTMGQQQSCPVSIQQQIIATTLNMPSGSSGSHSLSPRLVYTSRSPAAAAALSSPPPPALVMNGSGPQQQSSTPSPSSMSPPSVMCQLESRLTSSVSPASRQSSSESSESQPLNLSKKLFTAPMLKMES